MKGDFTRDTFDITKHFSRVLQQQGRVQVDADWNEQTAILLHYLRTLAADIIGPFAGPAGDSLGFNIENPFNNAGKWDFKIEKGRYYVDGILCENDEEGLTYQTQNDYPHPSNLEKTDHLVYLDVWERHISALEDDYIREKALDGPDTASRAKIVWQVKVESKTPFSHMLVKSDIKVPGKWSLWIELWQSKHRGCLRARVKQPDKSTDPCLTAPDAKYRGPENQLYRVEIHLEGPKNKATFKWSRDNGAIVTGCTLSSTELTVDNPRGFTEKGWVELTNDGQELRGKPGTLVWVEKIEGNVLTLSSKRKFVVLPDEEGTTWPTKARRWDHVERTDLKFNDDSGTVFVKEGSSDEDPDWIELENGIQIQFRPLSDDDSSHQYRTGDYWLIPARVATGNIEWPLELEEDGRTPVITQDGLTKPLPQPPHGIHHHYAPLAILNTNSTGWYSPPTDLRCEFHPLNNSCDLSYSYGEEGIGSHLLCVLPLNSSK